MPTATSIRQVGSLNKGSVCHPRSSRRGHSYVRTSWVVGGRNSEGQVILKARGSIQLLDPTAPVMVPRAPNSL